jgi:hypothetical protein
LPIIIIGDVLFEGGVYTEDLFIVELAEHNHLLRDILLRKQYSLERVIHSSVIMLRIFKFSDGEHLNELWPRVVKLYIWYVDSTSSVQNGEVAEIV